MRFVFRPWTSAANTHPDILAADPAQRPRGLASRKSTVLVTMAADYGIQGFEQLAF
jgi:hypothetical protein